MTCDNASAIYDNARWHVTVSSSTSTRRAVRRQYQLEAKQGHVVISQDWRAILFTATHLVLNSSPVSYHQRCYVKQYSPQQCAKQVQTNCSISRLWAWPRQKQKPWPSSDSWALGKLPVLMAWMHSSTISLPLQQSGTNAISQGYSAQWFVWLPDCSSTTVDYARCTSTQTYTSWYKPAI